MPPRRNRGRAGRSNRASPDSGAVDADANFEGDESAQLEAVLQMSLREAQSVQDQARREEEELQAALRASMEATAQQRSHTGQDQLPDCSSSAPTTSHPRNHTIALSDDEFDSMIDQSSLSQRLNDSESSVINLLDTTDEHPQPSSSNGRSKRKRPLTSSIDLSEDNETAPSTSRGRKKKALLDQVVDGCDSSRRKKKPNPPPPPPPMEDSNDVSSSRWKPSSRNVALDDSIDLDVPSPENDNSADSDYTDDQNESIESDFEAPDSSGGGPAFKVVTIPSQHSKSSDFYRQYREAESFYKKAVASTTSRKPLKIKSIDVVLNRELESRFEQLRETLANEGAPFEDSLSFHVASVSGGNMDRILRSNLHPRYATGQAFGNGLYFSKTPNSDEALFVCKIIPGRVFEDGSPCNIPLGYNSKKVTNLRNSGVDVTIVGGPDQILPSYVIYLERPKAATRKSKKKAASNCANGANENEDAMQQQPLVPRDVYGYNAEQQIIDARNGTLNANSIQEVLNNDQVVNRMRTMFESSLQLHATGQHMQACKAITTDLYPHQMYALAWMSSRENKKNLGVRGGILADDMGLGKTLSILSLILTNFHDQRPLAKPVHGYHRVLSKNCRKFLPKTKTVKSKDGKNGADQLSKKELASLDRVGKKCQPKAPTLSMKNLFGNLKKTERGSKAHHEVKRRKDTKQKIKSSRSRVLRISSDSDDENGTLDVRKPPTREKTIDEQLREIDDSSFADDHDSNDEFDSMISPKGLSDKLGLDDQNKKLLEKPTEEKVHFNDGLSDDEEYQNMTETERNEKMRPDYIKNKSCSGLNLDGASLELSSDEDFEPQPSTSKYHEPNRGEKEKGSKSGRFASYESEDDLENDELPDLDPSPLSSREDRSDCVTPEPESEEYIKLGAAPQLTPTQRKNLVVPPKVPAIVGNRRRPTLIVTPSSLISHWLEQIEQHVDPRVELKVFVHHGTSRALIGKELEDQDIVLTTYGTLMAEFNNEVHSPLLRAKWLRVCLDEGHMIKNSRAKTAKAAANLDTHRKWIISGTPIQNNLTELWSLLFWLDLEPYAGSKPLFKQHIELPVKHGDPRGVERLQTLIEAVCLRRTKSDKVNGQPLVKLPEKTVRVKDLEFTEEERVVYDAYLKQGRELIMRFMKRGNLLRNYAHVFAVMMRLRQLCCHKNLLPVDWSDVNMDDLAQMAKDDIGEEPKDNEAGAGDDGASDETKRLADQLRQMIKDGMTDECSICLSEFNQPVITQCAHVYCRPCITQVIESAGRPRSETQATCPLCRTPLTVDKLMEAAPDDEKEEEIMDEVEKMFEDIVIDVSSTKVNAVMKELAISKKRNAMEKTVVVSQFTSLLSILQPLLTEEGYNWTRLDGSMNLRERSSVIANFQDKSSSSPSILLLSLRAGGVGLNLTAASRLLLLDPAWNPSTEEQCFDRIHRLGQSKDVVVTKFVMANSIEQRMLEIQEKKRNLISGAFRQTEGERRNQRIADIRHIFGI